MTFQSLGVRVLTGSSAPSPRKAFTVRPYRRTRVPTARQLHMMNRMGCGFDQKTFTRMRRAGGEMAWFEEQLMPDSVPESGKAGKLPGWFPDLADGPMRRDARDDAGSKRHHEYGRDLANYTMLRRIYSNRTVLEMMVDFWNAHLHVPAYKTPGFTQRSTYDDTIRDHALGRFEDMLLECTLHPAMLLYLDNWRSVKNKPNENHGRELLELHTVGRQSGYTEAMVLSSAKILSGWTVDTSTWAATYDSSKHTTGSVQVLGFSHANGAADGRALCESYLRYLARHPDTARRIARKLAVRFVSDTPSAGLVQHLADVYTQSGTSIKATLRALVAHDEFWASAGQKVRTPIDDLVATCRVLRVQARKPGPGKAFATDLSWAHASTLLYHWPRPDGYPDLGGSWTTTSRMLSSFRMHLNLSGGYYPKGAVAYRKPIRYLPKKRIRMDQFVDHMSRVVLGRPSTELLLQAVCQGIDVSPTEIVTRHHAVFRWKMPRLLAVLLDTPAHLTR